jgi:hypothetical protein
MDIRGVYGFSSLMKQKKKAKICFVIYIAGFFLIFFCYEVIVKQIFYKRSANHYSGKITEPSFRASRSVCMPQPGSFLIHFLALLHLSGSLPSGASWPMIVMIPRYTSHTRLVLLPIPLRPIDSPYKLPPGLCIPSRSLSSATRIFPPSSDHPPVLHSVSSVLSLPVSLWLALRGILTLCAFAEPRSNLWGVFPRSPRLSESSCPRLLQRVDALLGPPGQSR